MRNKNQDSTTQDKLHTDPAFKEIEAKALQIVNQIYDAGGVYVAVDQEQYVMGGREIADAARRRELQAFLRRLGIQKLTETLSVELADRLYRTLIMLSIDLPRWLTDRNYQDDLRTLTGVLSEYHRYGDLNANDTRLRVTVQEITDRHLDELRKTLRTKPLDLSIHLAKILKTHPEYLRV